MGTSLSGLTPATTFDGLLKVGDNDPLTATLKPISTGDGTDTMLELSTSALQIGGATGMYWDNTNKRLGIGTNAPSTPLQVNGSIRSSGSGTQIFEFSSASLAQFRAIFGSVGFRVGSGMFIGGTDGGPASSTRLHIKGSGATSATTSLLVQNSAGGSVFSVRDDGALLFYRSSNSAELLRVDDTGTSPRLVSGNNANKSLTLGNDTILSSYSSIQFKTHDGAGYSEAMRITGVNDQFVGIGETTPTARLHVKGSGNDNTTTSLLVQNSDGTDLLKVTDDGILDLGDAGARGEITLGRSSDGAQMGSIFANANGLAIRGNSNVNTIMVGRNTNEGITINNATTYLGASLGVKGFGATSATTALLVQNSAGTELMSVDDDGAVRANSIKGINYQNNHLSLGANAEFLNFVSIKAPKIGVNGAVPTDTQAYIKGSGNDATTTALLVQNSDALKLLDLNDQGDFNLYGTNEVQILNSSAVNRVFIVNPTNHATVNFQVRGLNENNLIRTNASANAVGIGLLNASARLQVKGSGATSATTALLVENSAGTELMKVDDAGTTTISGNTLIQRSNGQLLAYFNSTAAICDFNPSNNAGFDTKFRGGTDNFLLYIDAGNDNVGMGTNAPDTSAKLQVDSTTQGFLPPRMTTTERDAISTPAAGLMVYNTTTNKAQCYNGTAWQDLF